MTGRVPAKEVEVDLEVDLFETELHKKKAQIRIRRNRSSSVLFIAQLWQPGCRSVVTP
jgi:hypothetical protein